MSQHIYTRCPECSTVFRVTEEHLKLAKGKVRCGACLSIFKATEHLVRPKSETPPPPVTQSPKPDESTNITNADESSKSTASDLLRASVEDELEIRFDKPEIKKTEFPIESFGAPQNEERFEESHPDLNDSFEFSLEESPSQMDTSDARVDDEFSLDEPSTEISLDDELSIDFSLDETDDESTSNEQLTHEYSLEESTSQVDTSDAQLDDEFSLDEPSTEISLDDELSIDFSVDETDEDTTSIEERTSASSLEESPSQIDTSDAQLDDELSLDEPSTETSLDDEFSIDFSLDDEDEINTSSDEPTENVVLDDQPSRVATNHAPAEAAASQDDPLYPEPPQPTPPQANVPSIEIEEEPSFDDIDEFIEEAEELEAELDENWDIDEEISPSRSVPKPDSSETELATDLAEKELDDYPIELQHDEKERLHQQQEWAQEETLPEEVYQDEINEDLPEYDEMEDKFSLDQISDNLGQDFHEPDPLDEFDDMVSEKSHALKWWLVSLVIVSLIGWGSVTFWNDRQTLAWDDTWGSMVHSICEYLPCDIKPRRDIAAIELLQRSISPNVEQPNLSEFSLIIRNNAAFEQPYPNIEIHFTDTNGNTVTREHYTPQEYLPPDLLKTQMPVNQRVHVLITAKNPHADAFGFEFTFH